MKTDYQNLKVDIENRIATITITRSKALNALNEALLNELCDVFQGLEKESDLCGAILTGEGKAFVAGADIAAMKGHSSRDAAHFCELGHRTMCAIEFSRFPVIAAVNGFALGGGLELALACDFIFASPVAKFGLPEVSLGLIPGFGGTQRLSRRIGEAKAKELIFTAQMLSAEEAYEWGIVNRIFPVEDLVQKTQETVQKISGQGSFAVSLAKDVVHRGSSLPLDEALALEKKEFPRVFETVDAREGIKAFLEKRKPKFQGK